MIKLLAVFDVETNEPTDAVDELIRTAMNKEYIGIEDDEGLADVFINPRLGYNQRISTAFGGEALLQSRAYVTIVGDLRGVTEDEVKKQVAEVSEWLNSRFCVLGSTVSIQSVK